MTKEQKELLLKDLCARLPYGVKCTYYDKCIDEEEQGTITGMQNDTYFVIDGVCIDVENVKPYIFPISSMNEEQRNEYNRLRGVLPIPSYYCDKLGEIVEEGDLHETVASIDYLYENHFDVHGLIHMGLAIDATNKNIY